MTGTSKYLPSEEKLMAFGMALDWRAPHAIKYHRPNNAVAKQWWSSITLCVPAYATEPDCIMISLPIQNYLMSFRPLSEEFFDQLLTAVGLLPLPLVPQSSIVPQEEAEKTRL
ncbi:hypothetical protein [Hymenobacter sp.]|uniref:hypothetical protein n=1 Tax=Hymenobacter sp. TaxID=1898978 RepID=UPI00286A0A84|nr:hypothetical protein [Hymenobacter sp.]